MTNELMLSFFVAAFGGKILWISSCFMAHSGQKPRKETRLAPGDDNFFRQFPDVLDPAAGPQRQIGHRTAALAKEMGMLGEIRAVTGGLAIVMDVAHEMAFHEGLQGNYRP